LIRLFGQIQTLEEMPLRCAVIPEVEELGFEARQLLFGRGRGVYRIIFRVLEGKRQVQILRVWHGSRHALTAEDVEHPGDFG
jgi:plasmid stabilization system protein ParE